MAEGEDFVIIDAIAYPVQTSGAKESVNRKVGHETFAYAGNLLSTVRDEFGEWTMVIGPIPQPDFLVLKAAVRLGRIVDVDGTFTPVPLRAKVDITGDYVPDGVEYQRVVNITVIEAEKLV